MFKKLLIAAAGFLALQAHAGLQLNSHRALVFDRDTGQTLYAKAADTAAPIASVTKLMTAIVLLEEKPDLRQKLTITAADVDRVKFSSSRLPVGTKLTKRDAMHLMLMSSENRAAHALARTSAGGMEAFVRKMNAKAQALGMTGANFADPTGLSPLNRARAVDLAKLLDAGSRHGEIRAFTRDAGARLTLPNRRQLQYVNSNPVVRSGWDVMLSKTGFIREAGRVVVMGFSAAGRNLGVVLMGADSTAARTADLVRVRNWVAGAAAPSLKASTGAGATTRSLKRGVTHAKAKAVVATRAKARRSKTRR